MSFDILFIHNNFPAQFKNLARKFLGFPGIRVRAIGMAAAPGLPEVEMQKYTITLSNKTVHPFARRFDAECHRAEQVIYAANALKLDGFHPKMIFVHPGWGEALPLRVIFPDATICAYAEFYYWPYGADVGFDPEFPSFGLDGETRVALSNAASLLSLVDANYAIAPTAWQRKVFPVEFRQKIHTIHDGFDLTRLTKMVPDWTRSISGRTFSPDDEIVTFVSRNMEPYRGFHIFMRCLPEVLRTRPRAQICLVGGDGVSYGPPPQNGKSWREVLLDQLRGQLDLSRVHFLGKLNYDDYLDVLARSSAHVYLTYPFVLSWSMLEAMAMQCLIIGSNTEPVAEVIKHGINGLLVPFFDSRALAEAIVQALAEPARFQKIRREAQATVVQQYDFERCCWPRHIDLLKEHIKSDELLALLGAQAGAESRKRRTGGIRQSSSRS